jgi:hypothetical protein
MDTEPLGLIAGKGRLPALFIAEASARGRQVAVVTFDKESLDALSQITPNVTMVGLGQAGALIKAFKEAGAVEITMLGKVDKRALFENPKFDLRAVSILKNLDFQNDDAVMAAIVMELEKEGFKVVNQVSFMEKHMPGAGHLAGRRPDERELADIEFGMRMARGIAALDIGQTVVVKDRAVVAVEAIEGTDEAIGRGGRITGPGAVVCKVSKPNQDTRFDIPTVGPGTVKVMAANGASALAIEAGKTLVVDIASIVEICERHGISFTAHELR